MGLKRIWEQHPSALHSSFHWLQTGSADGSSPVQSKGYQAILHQRIIGQIDQPSRTQDEPLRAECISFTQT